MMRRLLIQTARNPLFFKPLTWVLTIMAMISYIAIPIFPLYGEKNYINENAMAPSNHISLFNSSKYYEILNQLKNYSGPTLEFIENFYSQRDLTPYYQNFSAVVGSESGTQRKTGVNLFGILHPPRAQRDECNVIMFSHKGKEKLGSIAFSLAFLDLLATNHEINYLSRSIIFLAHDGNYNQHGRAALAFLESYFKGHTLPPNSHFPRCGILRQAINIEIDESNFNAVVLINDGVNGQLNDFDYYMNFNQMLNEHFSGEWTLDEDLTYERKINTFFNHYYTKPLNSILSHVRRHGIDLYLTQTLASFKRKIVGRTNYAHSYFMEYGVPAVTIKGMKSDRSRTSDTLNRLGKVIEATNRANMVLQEQLHVGSTLYVTLDLGRHITIGRFIYPFILFQFSSGHMIASFLLLKKRDQMFKLIWAALTHAISGIFLYFIPNLVQTLWNKFSSAEAYFGYDGYEGIANDNSSNSLIICFLVAAFVNLFVVRPLLEKWGFQIFEHYVASGTGSPASEVVSLDEQFIKAYGFPLVYICLGGSFWLIINLPFGIFSVIFLQPLILLVRPLSKRYWLNHIAFFGFIAIELALLISIIQTFDVNLFQVIGYVLGAHTKYVCTLWGYITLLVVPSIGMIRNLLLFNFNNRHL